MHNISDKPLPPSPLIPTSLEGGKVSDRLGQLKSSSESWKNRVEQSDASKFTVAGRLQKKAQSPVDLQFERLPNAAPKKCPPQIVRSANQPLLGLAKSPSMMVTSNSGNSAKTNGSGGLFVQRSLSVNNEVSELGSSASSPSNSDSDDQKELKEIRNNSLSKLISTKSGSTIAVPKYDDKETFENFFASKKQSGDKNGAEDVDIASFDHIKSTQR